MYKLTSWRARVAILQRDSYALYLVARDPRVPLLAKLVAGFVVAYALSPIDVIPDFIPVLGYLDDLVLIPLGIALAVRLVPAEVLAACRTEAAERFAAGGPKSRIGAAMVILAWLAGATWAMRALGRVIRDLSPR